MENKMKNILLLGLLAVFLSSCSESVQEIQVTTVEVSKTPLNLPNPDPLQLQDVEWIIITKDNAMEIFEKLKAAGGEYALFAVEDTGYEKIQVNYTDIRNKLAEQKQLLLAYKEYYESEEPEVTE
jgi:PBP1b-binding outer membrane lipoprotein LpoB|tara:strand:+ start:26 stop:400 length:375 start_codon:yes stop_codon:yes gene_type:complete